MSDVTKTLIVDAGNTSVKWTAFSGEEVLWRAKDLCFDQDDLRYDSFFPDNIYFASVRDGEKTSILLSDLKRKYQSAVFYILKTTSKACGIVNPYKTPDRLGIDRWLSVIAVGAGRSAIIVDAGTALKIEFIDEDRGYVGGFIVPGFEMMIGALVNNTGQIRVEENDLLIDHDVIDNTGVAIHKGCWQMMLAFVRDIYRKNSHKKFVFTGGDGLKIMQDLEIAGCYDADLVASGAKLLGDELVNRR